MDPSLDRMIDCFERRNSIFSPSHFWDFLNQKNLVQLQLEGYASFKQTVAQNYFTWLVGPRSDQFRYLLRRTRLRHWPSILRNLFSCRRSSRLTLLQQLRLQLFTMMIWKFAEHTDTEGLLKRIAEPLEGQPFHLTHDRKLISQDVANSVMEYYAMRKHFDPPMDQRATICELGAGYGRNAYVFAEALPNCRYIIVDIPPALYLSQRYLTSVFADRKVFKFRCFDDYSTVACELEQADFAFLLPHQMALLPKKCVDLFINISSLHEMTMPQIEAYFRLIDTLTKGYFYTKQWIVSRNPHDNVVINQSDYPVPDRWRLLYSHRAPVQVSFFEAMYATQ